MVIGAAVGVAASVVGVAFALGRKRGDGPSRSADRAEELELAYGRVIDELRVLDGDRNQHAPDEYEREKARLTREAVRLLKASEQARKAVKTSGSPAPASSQAKAASGSRDMWLGFACGAGSVVLAAVVALALWSPLATPAEDPAAAVATEDELPPGHPAADDPLVEALELVRQNPGDLDTSAKVARELVARHRLEEASALVDASLKVDPHHLPSRINRALIDGNLGDPRSAMETLAKLADKTPEGREALLARGALALQVADQKVALESFERYAREAPAGDQPPYLAHVLETLRAKGRPQ
jgi:tetratricopeptide (TPR) repeat protein